MDDSEKTCNGFCVKRTRKYNAILFYFVMLVFWWLRRQLFSFILNMLVASYWLKIHNDLIIFFTFIL